MTMYVANDGFIVPPLIVAPILAVPELFIVMVFGGKSRTIFKTDKAGIQHEESDTVSNATKSITLGCCGGQYNFERYEV